MGENLSTSTIEQQVWEQLKNCYDPEIPVNIVDLGLVYSCAVRSLPDGGYEVNITMTLTAPGCGMSEYLCADVQSKVSSIPGVKSARVELVWEPRWDMSMISEAAKLQLGLM